MGKRTGKPVGRPRTRPILPKKPVGNPNIVKDGEKTQLKKGHKLTKLRKVNGQLYRVNLNYLSLQPIKIDPNNVAESAAAAMQKLAHDGQGNTNAARVVAARMIERAIRGAEPGLVHELITQTEGNLVKKVKHLDENDNPVNFNKIVTDALVKSREKEIEEQF